MAFHDKELPHQGTGPFSLTLRFHGWLTELTRRARHGSEPLSFTLGRRTTIKDLAESYGVPHTEIGSIQFERQPVSFDFIIEQAGMIDIHPERPPVNVSLPSMLRPKPPARIRFLVDANVGKLAGKLRMAGFDTLYYPEWEDGQLAEAADKKGYILLSRDLQLLKRKKVRFGHFVRETLPVKQLGEVIYFYNLLNHMKPFSRCMNCNHELHPVSKEKISSQLEPLTMKYYTTFLRCKSCRQVYWPGSHRDAMEKDLEAIRNYSPLPY